MDVRFQVNGVPATLADLGHLALVNYGCFTVMQVEVEAGRRGVRGLDLHLARLHAGALALFGRAVSSDRLRDLMNKALVDESGSVTLRVNLFSRAISVRNPSAEVEPDVLIAVQSFVAPLTAPLSLRLVAHTRDTPELKHVATYDLIRRRRAARAAGFDDVLFATDGLISEGATWNVGFLSGDTVVWPLAPMLAGTGQALLQAGLETLGVSTITRPIPIDDLRDYDSAFIVNAAVAAQPVSAIDDIRFASDPDRVDALIRAYRAAPLQPL